MWLTSQFQQWHNLMKSFITEANKTRIIWWIEPILPFISRPSSGDKRSALCYWRWTTCYALENTKTYAARQCTEVTAFCQSYLGTAALLGHSAEQFLKLCKQHPILLNSFCLCKILLFLLLLLENCEIPMLLAHQRVQLTKFKKKKTTKRIIYLASLWHAAPKKAFNSFATYMSNQSSSCILFWLIAHYSYTIILKIINF